MQNDNRRRSERIKVVCEIALKVGEDYFDCRTSNLSVSGAKMELLGGNIGLLRGGMVAECWIDYQGFEFAGHCTIVRASGKEIAARFVGLDIKQHFDLRKIIELATAITS